MAEKVYERGSVQERLFNGLHQLKEIRKNEDVFMTNADCYTVDAGDNAVLVIGREYAGEKMFGIFNFSGENKTINLHEEEMVYIDLTNRNKMKAGKFTVKGNSFFWLKRA